MNNKQDILFDEISGKSGDLGSITLNRPKVLNALTLEMCIAIDERLAQWDKDKNIKAVIIRGAGEKAFCAGGDIRDVYKMGPSRADESQIFFWHEYRMNRRLFHFSKPYVAFLDGITMGGGVGVSIHGSHKVATENLVFAMPETGIGFFPDIGASYFLSRCPGKTGYFLGLTGIHMDAAGAYYLKLVDHVIASDNITAIIDKLASTEFTEAPHVSVTHILNGFNQEVPEPQLALHRDLVDKSFSQHSVADIIAGLKSGKDLWVETIVRTLETKSPTSMSVTLREIREAEALDFDGCIKMEYRIAKHFLQGHDFYEGVRAAIIDKDQSPKWSPSQLSDITPVVINAYFEPLPEGELSFA